MEALHPLLVEFEGKNVASAAFVINRPNSDGGKNPEGYLAQDGSFTASLETAKRVNPQSNGQVLVMGLEPGPYIISEVGLGLSLLLPFTQDQQVMVSADMVEFRAFMNTEQSFGVLFEKLDGESQEPLGGGQFQVYRLKEGIKEYVAYYGNPVPGDVIMAYYTTQVSQAHVFRANTYERLDYSTLFPDLQPMGRFLVPGLEKGYTYYLHEISAPAGYEPLAEDLAFSEDQAYDQSVPNTDPVKVNNTKKAGAFLFKKMVLAELYSGSWPTYSLPDIGFFLTKIRHVWDEEGNYSMMVSVAQSGGTQPGEAIEFGKWFDTQQAFVEYFLSIGAETYEPSMYDDFVKTFSEQVYYTDVAGNLALFELPEGLPEDELLMLLEVDKPDWLVSGSMWNPFVVQDGQVIGMNPSGDGRPTLPTILNYPQLNSIQVHKTDPHGNADLAGARFRLMVKVEGQESETQVYLKEMPWNRLPNELEYRLNLTESAEEAQIFETDQDGRVAIVRLPFYNEANQRYHYTLIEITPPNGYLIQGDGVYSAGLEPYYDEWGMDRNNSVIMHITNIPIPPIPLALTATKQVVDADGQALPLADFPPFEFDLFYQDRLLGSAQSDKEGQIVFSGLFLNPAWFTAEELRAPIQLKLQEKAPASPIPGMSYQKTPLLIDAHLVGEALNSGDVPAPRAKASAVAVPVAAARSVPTQEWTSPVISLVLQENLELVFTNTFVKPKPEDSPPPNYPVISVPISATKKLTGGALKGDDFTFVLKDYAGKELQRVSNAKDGSITFNARRFSRAGTFLYTIEEVKGEKANLTYDKTRYTVRVRVTAMGGALSAQTDILKDGTPYAGGAVFQNRIKPPTTGDNGPQMILMISLSSLSLALVAVLLSKRRKTSR